MGLPTNIKTLLSGNVVEWARIEFKETWDAEASLKTICAFANDIDNWGGGYLVIGVEDKDGKPTNLKEEALANAVYHKGYDEREPIEVRVHPDRIEIVSHPGADRSITMDGLKNYRVFNRRYRNRRIGEFLKELHLTEGRNTGFGKILRALEKNGSPKPIFETDDERTSFAATIFEHPSFDDTGTTGKTTNQATNQANQADDEELELRILNAIRESANITQIRIAKETGITLSSVKYYIEKMKKEGIIKREGTSQKGKWVILK